MESVALTLPYLQCALGGRLADGAEPSGLRRPLPGDGAALRAHAHRRGAVLAAGPAGGGAWKVKLKLAAGAMVALGVATARAGGDAVHRGARRASRCPGSSPTPAPQLRGRAVYIANGCVYCHTPAAARPQRRPRFRARLGPAVGACRLRTTTSRICWAACAPGPDLFNIGARQPSKDWHLGHLYQPRAYVPGSIMPPYPYPVLRQGRGRARRAGADPSARRFDHWAARWWCPRPRRSTSSSTCRGWITPIRCCRPSPRRRHPDSCEAAAC